MNHVTMMLSQPSALSHPLPHPLSHPLSRVLDQPNPFRAQAFSSPEEDEEVSLTQGSYPNSPSIESASLDKKSDKKYAEDYLVNENKEVEPSGANQSSCGNTSDNEKEKTTSTLNPETSVESEAASVEGSGQAIGESDHADDHSGPQLTSTPRATANTTTRSTINATPRSAANITPRSAASSSLRSAVSSRSSDHSPQGSVHRPGSARLTKTPLKR